MSKQCNTGWLDRPLPGPLWLHRILRGWVAPLAVGAGLPLIWIANQMQGQSDQPPLWTVLCVGILLSVCAWRFVYRTGWRIETGPES